VTAASELPRRPDPATRPRAVGPLLRAARESGWEPSATRAPDKRSLLSNFRTLSSVKSVKFHRAVTGPAVAIVAVVAGTVGAWSAGTAGQPAAIHRPAGLVRSLAPIQTGPGLSPSSSQPAGLDAFFATASKPGSHPAVTTAGATRRRSRRALTPR